MVAFVQPVPIVFGMVHARLCVDVFVLYGSAVLLVVWSSLPEFAIQKPRCWPISATPWMTILYSIDTKGLVNHVNQDYNQQKKEWDTLDEVK
jgi:hypothetical protein